jgi:hypothetical protein
VSEPAPREIICFGVAGGVERRNERTKVSIDFVRIYVPILDTSINIMVLLEI